MFQWLRDIRSILKKECETEQAYLHGQQLESNPHLSSIKPKFSGAFLRLLRFLVALPVKCRVFQRPSGKIKINYLVYASSSNQMNSLESTLREIQKRKLEFLAIGEPYNIDNEARKEIYQPLTFSPLDVAKAILLVLMRGYKLHSRLRRSHDPVAVNFYFDIFCKPYIYLPYFLSVLQKHRPSFVITSNDHNVENRCLVAIAHYLKIKTVYMQHASVSDLFPALRFDYAFLDGQASLECYQKCEGNSPGGKAGLPNPTVFLSGQKKHLQKPLGDNPRLYVGFAVNNLDACERIIQTAMFLANRDVSLRLRWHPGQSKKDVDAIKSRLAKQKNVTLSDPAVEYVGNFLGQCHTLIAGDSSIHLEAALIDVRSVYFELAPAHIPDYYGYVASGLAEPAANIECILRMLTPTDSTISRGANVDAIRLYSASYGTLWDGHEGELVVETLQHIIATGPLEPLYVQQENSGIFAAIYSLPYHVQESTKA